MKKYFHGDGKAAPYFEGWYFKCQTRNGHSLGLIPALHIHRDGQKRASIQVITEDAAWWLEYPAVSFSARKESLYVQIGANLFSENGLVLDIEQQGISLHGRISFSPFLSLKSDIMGPFQWVPNMECVHSVISMEHSLQGQVEINGTALDFSGGTGYIEADRGHSFPTAYLWTQCMWNTGSLMLSVATVPLGKFRFTGCICALIWGGQEYRLATYRGAVIERWSAQGAAVRQGQYRLEVQLLEQTAQPLRAPFEGCMSRTVHESLCAKVRCRFWCGSVLLFDHTPLHAGFEFSQS